MTKWLNETVSQYKRRLDVALGNLPADTLFTGARVLNVYTGELLKADFALSGDRIAYVHYTGLNSMKAEKHIDLTGKIVVPGYFDPHAHTDLFYSPWEFARAVAARGTTAVFSDSHDMANGLGMEGFVVLLKNAKDFPLRFLSGVPLASPPYPVEGEDLYDISKVRRLLKFGEVIRSGSELTPWVKVMWQDETLLQKLYTVRRATGRLEGHTVGARDEKLAALVTVGITSCHESLSPRDVEERLRLGLYVMLRQGSIRREFDALSLFLRSYHPRIMLTPDGLFADEIWKDGYLDAVLKEALDHGGDPIAVIRMVTLNPAIYFGLEPHLGGIAPGRLADFNVLDDLRNPTPEQVWIGGRLVSREGVFLKKGTGVGKDLLAQINRRPFTLSRLGPEDFKSRYPEGFPSGIPVITVVDKTVTGIYEWNPYQVATGAPDPESDILKIALVHRDGPGAGMGIGYVRGFGLYQSIQVASSVAHETHNILVMGDDDGEMAFAANEVVRMGGGVVVRWGAKTVFQWPLPIGGMMSDRSMSEVAKALQDLRHILKEGGSPLEDPLWTFVFLSFTSILRLRITISGVYDVKTGEVLYNAKV